MMSVVLWKQCVKKSVQHEGGEHGVTLLYERAWGAPPGTQDFQGSTKWET